MSKAKKQSTLGTSSSNDLAPYRPLELMRNENLTKVEFNDFIAVWEKFVPDAFCDQLVEYGNSFINEVNGHTIAASDVDIMEGSAMYGGNIKRDDTAFLVNYASEKWATQINQFLKACAQHYVSKYSQLKSVPMTSMDIKFQKTEPGGGYHLWHYENASSGFAQRELTWMIYLNDIDDGGETEFLYQKRRIKPQKGTVVIFPAGMTHVHKGNLVMGDRDKYIVTGWYIKAGSN